MENQKRVIILVVIALILAITAIALNINDSEISTTGESSDGLHGGEIGIEIAPSAVEDKLVEEGAQS